jgi:uncharacterized protein YndB with AHSA1/START domain
VSREIRIEMEYPFPPERVWRALTDRAEIADWLMASDFEPRVGHRFTFRTTPRPGFDGIVECQVTEVDPPRRLSYTWQGGWLKVPSVVTYELEPTADGTRLRFLHSGLEGIGGLAISFILGGGWKRMFTRAFVHHLAREERSAA